MEWLSSTSGILLAVLGFGFVIFIHELGHFLFAKWAGVQVLRFSIGFGPILWRRRIGETEYALSALPLGGYVKMTGEHDDDEAEEKSDPRSFQSASAGWRALILLAGVLFNFISSYLILLALGAYRMPVVPPVVGGVEHTVEDQRSPAYGLGLRPGDRIVELNGHRLFDLLDLRMRVIRHGTEPVRLKVERIVDGTTTTLELPAAGTEVRPVHGSTGANLGIEPAYDTAFAIVDLGALAGPAAAQAQKRAEFERIVAIDGAPVPAHWVGQQILHVLKPLVGRNVALRLQDERGAVRDASISYAGSSNDPGGQYGLPVRIATLVADGPARNAGLRPGDIVCEADGVVPSGSEHLIALVNRAAVEQRALRLVVDRLGERRTIEVTPVPDPLDGVVRIGVQMVPVANGRLPVLPTALGSDRNALVAADPAVVPGMTLITDEGRDGQPILRLLSGGTPLQVRVPGEQDAQLLRRSPSGTRPSPASKLIGNRVLGVADGAIRVASAEAPTAEAARVPLDRFSPAAQDALRSLREGDWIVAVYDDHEGGNGATIEILRGASGDPRILQGVKPLGQGQLLVRRTMQRPVDLHGAGDVVAFANARCELIVFTTLELIPRFFRGKEQGGIDATKSLQGPIGIFGMLKDSAENGFASFLYLVALLGLNLFLVNLLPIPMVDGGQLVFLGAETLMRRKLPAKVKLVANAIGFAIIVTLMVFALSLDILRKFGWV